MYSIKISDGEVWVNSMSSVNKAKFINHAPKVHANLEFVDCNLDGYATPILKSTRLIGAGEELFVDYGVDYFVNEDTVHFQLPPSVSARAEGLPVNETKDRPEPKRLNEEPHPAQKRNKKVNMDHTELLKKARFKLASLESVFKEELSLLKSCLRKRKHKGTKATKETASKVNIHTRLHVRRNGANNYEVLHDISESLKDESTKPRSSNESKVSAHRLCSPAQPVKTLVAPLGQTPQNGAKYSAHGLCTPAQRVKTLAAPLVQTPQDEAKDSAHALCTPAQPVKKLATSLFQTPLVESDSSVADKVQQVVVQSALTRLEGNSERTFMRASCLFKSPVSRLEGTHEGDLACNASLVRSNTSDKLKTVTAALLGRMAQTKALKMKRSSNCTVKLKTVTAASSVTECVRKTRLQHKLAPEIQSPDSKESSNDSAFVTQPDDGVSLLKLRCILKARTCVVLKSMIKTPFPFIFTHASGRNDLEVNECVLMNIDEDSSLQHWPKSSNETRKASKWLNDNAMYIMLRELHEYLSTALTGEPISNRCPICILSSSLENEFLAGGTSQEAEMTGRRSLEADESCSDDSDVLFVRFDRGGCGITMSNKWSNIRTKFNIPDQPLFFAKVYNDVSRRHWILYFVDFNNKTVHYFDSLKNPDVDYSQYSVGLLDVVYPTVDAWKHSLFEDMPQQRNTYDCGVWVCAVLLCLISSYNENVSEYVSNALIQIKQLNNTNVNNLRAHMWSFMATGTTLVRYISGISVLQDSEANHVADGGSDHSSSDCSMSSGEEESGCSKSEDLEKGDSGLPDSGANHVADSGSDYSSSGCSISSGEEESGCSKSEDLEKGDSGLPDSGASHVVDGGSDHSSSDCSISSGEEKLGCSVSEDLEKGDSGLPDSGANHVADGGSDHSSSDCSMSCGEEESGFYESECENLGLPEYFEKSSSGYPLYIPNAGLGLGVPWTAINFKKYVEQQQLLLFYYNSKHNSGASHIVDGGSDHSSSDCSMSSGEEELGCSKSEDLEKGDSGLPDSGANHVVDGSSDHASSDCSISSGEEKLGCSKSEDLEKGDSGLPDSGASHVVDGGSDHSSSGCSMSSGEEELGCSKSEDLEKGDSGLPDSGANHVVDGGSDYSSSGCSMSSGEEESLSSDDGIMASGIDSAEPHHLTR